MRVVHITTVPESLVGFLRGQLASLHARGLDMIGITSPGRHLEAFDGDPRIQTIPIEMHRRITPVHDLGALARLIAALARVQPAIVHAHTPKGGLLGMIAATVTRVPVRIYHMRGLPLETATGWQKRVLRGAERISCALATRVLCVSRSLREVAVGEGLCDPTKIEVLGEGSGQGVDAKHFDPARLGRDARHTARRAHQIPDDAIVIGFVGRLVRDKGVVELVTAWQSLRERDLRLHLVIAGVLEDRDALPPEVVAELQADARVHVTGFIADIVPLYAAMDIVVLPTYREGFPNVPLEAAAMCKPVVATRVTGCVDAVVDGVTGMLVPAGDPAALASALWRYVEDPALRDAHGRAGRKRVIASFRPERIAELTYDKYRELVAAVAPRRGMKLGQRAAKRAFDIIASAAGLAVLSPVLLGSAAAIRATMGSPVLFTHVRPGRDGKLFELYKFRTMRAPSEHDRSVWFRSDEERLTPLGRFLRSSSIDELPELWNVLRGDMSIVGPRPLLKEYLERYTPEQHRRHEVRPGITGWAQVHGRQAIKFSKRLEHDVWYVDHWSIWLDLVILVKTVRDVFGAKGVIPGQNVDDVDDLGLAPDRGPRANRR